MDARSVFDGELKSFLLNEVPELYVRSEKLAKDLYANHGKDYLLRELLFASARTNNVVCILCSPDIVNRSYCKHG